MALGPALEYCSEKLQTEIREKGDGGESVFPLEQPRLLRVTSPGQQNFLNRFFKRPEVAGQTEPTFFYSLPVQFRPEDGRWHWVASWNDADGNNFDVSEHLPRLEEGSWVLEKAERSLDEYKKMASQTGGPPLPAEKWCLYTYSLYGQDGPWNAQPCFDAGVVCESTPTRFDTGEEEDDDDDDDDDIETKTKIEKLIKEVGEVKKGLRQLPPIGFIYVQLPGERSPTELWPPSLVSFPQYQWTDVSDSFDSLFFRVAGKRAEAFGKVQEQQTPGLGPFIDGVKRERCQLNGDRSACLEGNDKLKNRNNCSAPVSHFLTSSVNGSDDKFCSNDGWSAPLWTAFNYASLSEAYDDVKAYADYHQYHLSSSSAIEAEGTAEVRPRNMAVKVWKRTG